MANNDYTFLDITELALIVLVTSSAVRNRHPQLELLYSFGEVLFLPVTTPIQQVPDNTSRVIGMVVS